MENQKMIKLLKKLKVKIINVESYRFRGMCLAIVEMRGIGSISIEEYKSIFNYFNQNAPQIMQGYKQAINKFWWTQGKKEPRLNWIDEQIKKLESCKNN